MPEVAGTEFGLTNLTDTLSLEGLTQLGQDGRALPKLAENWNWENDGLRLRLKLRSGVTFHDGTPLTSELASKILTEALTQPGNRALFLSLNDVTTVRADGELQIIMDLSHRSAFLPEDLEVPLGIGTVKTGTGAYRVIKRDPSEVILERFTHYYLGTPAIERIVIRPARTLRTAWTSLLRGEVAMVMDVPADAEEFVQNEDVQVISFRKRYQYLIAFNSKKPPLNSALVRRALNAAIDRPSLITKVLQGHGVPSVGPLWPRHWAYDTSVTSTEFDPGSAMSLLDSAGVRRNPQRGGQGARFRFTCLLPANFSVLERVALEIQKQMYDVGVDIEFEVLPSEQYTARIVAGNFDAALINIVSGPTIGRGYQFWRSSQHFKGLNVFGYENAEAERLYDILRSSTNEAAVRSAMSRFQRILLEDPPALFLAWDERARAIRRDFQIVQDPSRDPSDPVYTIWRWNSGNAPTSSPNP